MTSSFAMQAMNHEINLIKMVNKAIHAYKVPFYVHCTVDGKVQQFPIIMLRLNFEASCIEIEYDDGTETNGFLGKVKKASQFDLKMISARAQQLAKQSK